MRLLTSAVLVACVALAGARAGHAQDPAPQPAPDLVYVDIETNLPASLVYADSVLVGALGEGPVALPAGTREVRLVAVDYSTWTVPPVSAPLEAAPGDTVVLGLSFPYRYHVESVPFGAAVHLETAGGWQKLGETPLDYTSATPLEGTLVVQEPGYVLVRLTPGREVWNAFSVSLNPESPADPEAARVAWKPPRRSRAWIDYAAIGTALAAGAVAVHYKFKADRLFGEYTDPDTDPALRPQIKERFNRFDTYSGVSLGVMQAGIGLFAIRLALR